MRPLDLLNELLRPGASEPFELSEEGARQLSAAITPYFGTPELIEVVEDLARFAVWVGNDVGAPKLQAKLFTALEPAIPALHRLGHDASSLAVDLEKAAKEKDYGRLTGSTRALLTPAEAPEGSIGSGPLARFRLSTEGEKADPDKPKAPKPPRRW